MADDIVTRGFIVGKPADEIAKVLGTPEAYSPADARKMYYLVDKEYKGPVGIDPCRIEHLVVYLRDDQHALRAEHEVTLDKC